MGRVLLGNLEPIVRVGIAAVLREDGVEIVDDQSAPLVPLARRLRPDAVVLDIADESSRAVGARIRRAAPQAAVVFWARDEDVMEVLAPGARAPRRVLEPNAADLSRAVLAPEA
jgi:DNA-binding NarL/FixJ family response regulator